MPNTTDTFKTGEIVLIDGEYECLICRQGGTRTVSRYEKGKIFSYCDACGVKEGAYRLVPAASRT